MAVKFQIEAPYVGPRPFERQHQALFFGRNREAHELVSLVIAHRAVLIYAPSGAGKTSLLNAGLLPLLEEERFEILPPARVQGVIPQDLSADTIANIYVFNVLISWAEPDADQAQLAQMSLVEFLAGREHLVDEIDLPQPRLIILDQFEELFTAYPERWPEREGFFRQVDNALAADPLLRVLFSVREDYLGQLDGYSAFLPERLQTRFRLPRLGRVAALAAITQPLHGTGRSFAPGVAEKLVEELLQVRVETAAGATVVVEGEYVEPVQLQVVCQSLWQGLPPDAAVITSDHLQAFGDVNQALSQFYERSIKQTVQATGVREGDLRNWFEFSLITPAGTRGTVYRGAGQSGPIPHAAMDLLEDLHLIRGEWRAGARWYELTHDRFIEPIQQCNERWLEQRREAAQACERLEAQAAEWVRMGRGRGGLLDEVELRDAERWLPILAEADLGYSEDVPALVAMSRAAIEEAERERTARQQRELAQARALAEAQSRRAEEQAAAASRLRRLALALAAVLLLAVVAAVVAVRNAQEAAAARANAERN
ncbi:MAG TPA: hypothetical protein VNK95_00575, partial [Caldilineaceae bacterium]|nr:hypothetical protein [Caldilineaceae bacterium]